MIIGTTSRKELLNELDMLNTFSGVVSVANIMNTGDLERALEIMEDFTTEQRHEIVAAMTSVGYVLCFV